MSDAELKAALEWAVRWLEACGNFPNANELFLAHAAVLRAHLATFDEERAFLEAARHAGEYRNGATHVGVWVWEDFDRAYRALVAKREG